MVDSEVLHQNYDKLQNKHQFHKRRLAALTDAFVSVDTDISGTPANPLIIFQEDKMLRTRIVGPLIHFLDRDQEIVDTFNISGLELDQEYVENYVKEHGFIEVFRIKLMGARLFVAGFDYKIKEGKGNMLGKYPVFGRYKLRYFFSEEDARLTMEEFSDYSLELV